MTDKTKPFDYAQEVTKQVLTLATAIVTITVSFLKDVVTSAPSDARTVLYVSWSLLAISMLAGICTLLNLTGHVGKADEAGSEGVMAPGIRCFSIIQLISFALATCGIVYFGARSFT